jgi:hypothetical protein
MTRNRDYAAALGRGLDDLDASGNADAPAGTAVRSFSTNDDLLTADNSSYKDGQLHYMTNTNDLWIWDDSDGKFYEVTLGDAPSLPTYSPVQGQISGYSSGGQGVNIIQKYSFTADGNATDVGDLTFYSAGETAGQSSTTHGYQQDRLNSDINKFAFASDGNATNIITNFSNSQKTVGHSSTTHGYASGGNPGARSNIKRFPFSSETTTEEIGNLSAARSNLAGQSSTTHGYSSGGEPDSNTLLIDKFPFAVSSGAYASNVGNLSAFRYGGAGQSSDTHGYTSGGDQYPVSSPQRNANYIDKFPFASDDNATDVGDLTWARGLLPSGTSSRESGYTAGGRGSSSSTGGGNLNAKNIIDKFSFASDGNATDVGDLITTIYEASGQQV